MSSEVYKIRIAYTDTTMTLAIDEPDSEIGGGANHTYEITDKDGKLITIIPFQKGAVAEHGANGIRDVDLMQILRHRLVSFQNGDFKCEANEKMLYHICAALNWENKRTEDRENRGVEGTSEK